MPEQRTLKRRADLSTSVYQVYADQMGYLWGIRLGDSDAPEDWEGTPVDNNMALVVDGADGALEMEPVTRLDGKQEAGLEE
jgi:hypothetical protein